MYIINLILVFRLPPRAHSHHIAHPTSVTSTGLNGPMKQECTVSFSHPRRVPHSLFLSLIRVYMCILSRSTRYVFFLRPCRAILVPTRTISLPDDSDPAQHKRVINYLRVGHVFPSCSLSSFRSFLPPLLFRLFLLPTVSPAAFHLAPLTLRVCTHSLMLIRLNAQKPSRGRSKRLASPRLASPRRKITGDHEEGAHDDWGGHGRSRRK